MESSVARKEVGISDITISDVNIITSDLEYIKNVTNWQCEPVAKE